MSLIRYFLHFVNFSFPISDNLNDLNVDNYFYLLLDCNKEQSLVFLTKTLTKLNFGDKN